ncbi:DNA-binding transcriptional regulator, FadR family [Asanoa hainanensis]|uniref:DNA-binding transcriptional regulator, FadR family n=1 Tax=Asanoa hainanensis TaxID=560556 RepID=A0A239MMX0_9ACTN|nr:FadR/GntR family transcriptional regulator [Asanoa hainanensis]SNT44081.1 DNA-binding transcriptional regulator, FadR family [Asanoa hainanensis]
MLRMTLSRSTLVQQVISALSEQIQVGEWPIGSKIPTEPQLVELLGVGRNTVREAVKALTHAGVLEGVQGSGTYVRSTDELTGVVARKFGGSDPEHTIEVRRALEVEAARLAALRRTPEDLEKLDAALVARDAAWQTGDVDVFVEADADLHVAVVAAAHNPMLAELYASVGAAVRASVAVAVGPSMRAGTHIDHGRLVGAIRDRDADRAAHEAGKFLEAPARE